MSALKWLCSAAAFEFEVEAPLPQKKRHVANQFQGGRWLHAGPTMNYAATVNGTEDHRLHDGDGSVVNFAMKLNKPEQIRSLVQSLTT